MSRRLLMVLCLLAASLGSCTDTTLDNEFMYNSFDLLVVGPGGISGASLEGSVVATIDGAELTIDVALEHLESTTVSQALIRAHRRGVSVRVVGDVDHRDQAGFVELVAELGEGPEGRVRLGNGALTYSPQPTVSVSRTGAQSQMTHNFLIVDGRILINLSGGFWADLNVNQVGFVSVSEDLPRDFGDEFDQMYGGVFSTTLDSFNGPLKSDSNPRFNDPTDEGDLELYFGPQERLVKQAIDEVYAARASIYISTESLESQPLLDALEYKVAAGFTVSVLVDESSINDPDSLVPRLRAAIDRGVQVNGGRVRGAAQNVRSAANVKQTVVITDAEVSPINGDFYRSKVLVLSQPLVNTAPFFPVNGALEAVTSDVFIDSNMWVLNQYVHKTEPPVLRLTERFLALYGAATPVPSP